MNIRHSKNVPELYLLGSAKPKIDGNELPTKMDILRVLFYNTQHSNKTLNDAYNIVLDDVLEFWRKKNIKTKAKRNCLRKLKKLYTDYRNIQKKTHARYEGDISAYEDELKLVFDIEDKSEQPPTEQLRSNFIIRLKTENDSHDTQDQIHTDEPTDANESTSVNHDTPQGLFLVPTKKSYNLRRRKSQPAYGDELKLVFDVEDKSGQPSSKRSRSNSIICLETENDSHDIQDQIHTDEPTDANESISVNHDTPQGLLLVPTKKSYNLRGRKSQSAYGDELKLVFDVEDRSGQPPPKRLRSNSIICLEIENDSHDIQDQIHTDEPVDANERASINHDTPQELLLVPTNNSYNLRERKSQPAGNPQILLSSHSSPSASQSISQGQESISSVYKLTGRDYEKLGLRGTVDFLTENLTTALDYAKVSYRNNVRLCCASAEAFNIPIDDLVLNKSSFHPKRSVIRAGNAEKIKTHFQAQNLDAVVVHWDGKQMANNSGERVERLAISISNGTIHKTLGSPELENSKARTIAVTVHDTVDEWGVRPRCLCCDTTNANRGCKAGAAVLLELFLDTDLLWLPCRHHIYEIVLGAVFELKIPGTNGPNVQLFKNFRSQWTRIDKSNFEIPTRESFPLQLVDQVDDLIAVYQNYVNQNHPRDDYKELAEVCLIFLGGIPNEMVKFHPPGAMHHARWMAKGIYSPKMYLLRHELDLSADQINALYDISLFVVFVYAQFWFKAPLAVTAPTNDLAFLKKLKFYRSVDEAVANIALHKFDKHLWYLSIENSALALFDQTLPIAMVEKMVKALEFDPGDMVLPKRVLLRNPNELEELIDQDISYFMNAQSLKFLDRFDIGKGFLEKEISSWPDDEEYLKGVRISNGLLVVNDIAERTIKLTEEYVNVLSRDEGQNQFIIQGVEDYRKNFEDANKSTFMRHQAAP